MKIVIIGGDYVSRRKYKTLELEKRTQKELKEFDQSSYDTFINCIELIKNIVVLKFPNSKHEIVLNYLEHLESIKEKYRQEKEDVGIKYDNEIAAIEQEQAQIKVKIDSIEDNLIREAFKIKYIEGGSWEQIAKKIGYSLTHTYRLIDYWCSSPSNAAIKAFIE